MEPKLLLLQSLMLLFWENVAKGTATDSRANIREILHTMEVSEGVVEMDESRNTIENVRYTILELCDESLEEPYDLDALKQRLRINCEKDDFYYSAITSGIPDEIPEYKADVVKKKCVEYSRSIYQIMRKREFEKKIRSWSATVLYSSEAYDLDSTIQNFQTELESFANAKAGHRPEDVEGITGYVDFADTAALEQLFEDAKEEVSLEGVLKTGWQALNRMFGSNKGMRRGDFILVGALQHNFKTGFTLNITRQVAIYNTPFMLDPDKKPLILHISSENVMTENLLLTYQQIIELATGKPCDVTDIDKVAATKVIQEETFKSGYHFKMIKVDPSDFTYTRLFQTIMNFEAEGYEIHFMTIDYLNMFNKAGCVQGAQGQDTRDLFRRVRNFTNRRKITTMTPHQISSDAKRLLRTETVMGSDFVKSIVNKGYYDSCTTIDQEVDMEILIHIVKCNGRSYLTIQRGKHRKSGPQTPEKDLFCILPFFDVGAIRDDINGEDLSVSRVGQMPGSGGGGDMEGHDFFDMVA